MVELETGFISICELLFEKLLITLLLGGVETPPSFQSQFCTRWRTFYRIQLCDGKPKMTNARYGISLFLFQQPQLPFSHEIGPQSTSSNQFPNASTLFCVWHYVLEARMWTEGVPLLGGTHVKRTRRQPRFGTCVAFPMYQYCPTSFPVLYGCIYWDKS